MSMTVQAVINPTPERKILKPLGYVQKTDGTIEAIVPDGDGVQVVHVGDPYQEKYTVAQISPHGVVMTANAGRAPSAGNSQTVETASTASPAKSVGYIEKSDGRRMDVVAGGGTVSLVNRTEPQPVLASGEALVPAGQTVVAAQLPEAARAVDGRPSTPKSFDSRYQSAPALDSTLIDKSVEQSGIPPKAIGFVEKTDGKVQAIVEDGDGVRLAAVASDQVATLTGQVDALEAENKGRLTATPSPSRSNQDAGLIPGTIPPPGTVAGNTLNLRESHDAPGGTLEARNSSLLEGEPSSPSQLPGQTDYSPPPPEVALVDGRVIPEKPPPDNAAIIASFCDSSSAGQPLGRSSAILDSLGIIGGQDGRASPEAASFEPGAPANGPPDTSANIPSSFGYEDWMYGQPFNLLEDSRGNQGVSESYGNPPAPLKPIGYIQWQDGRTLAVLKDGDGGVRFLHEGELLDSQHIVGKISANSVEITHPLHLKPSASMVSQVVEVLPIRADAGIALLFETKSVPAKPSAFSQKDKKAGATAQPLSATSSLATNPESTSRTQFSAPQGHSALGKPRASCSTRTAAATISSLKNGMSRVFHRISK